MLPIIFQIGPFKLYSYIVFLFLALFSGLFVLWKRGIELRFDEEDLFDAAFTLIFWMLAFGRVGYIIAHWSDFGFNVWQWVNIFGRPGFIGVSSILGLFFGLWYVARKKSWDYYALGDVIVVSTVMMQIWLAIGAFFNGSGYGYTTDSIFGVKLPNIADRHFPVPLFENLMYIGLYIFLWEVEGIYRTFSWYKGVRSQALSGFVFASYLIGYGGSQYIAALLRPAIFSIGSFNLDKVIYLGILIAGLIILYIRSGIRQTQMRKKKARRARTQIQQVFNMK